MSGEPEPTLPPADASDANTQAEDQTPRSKTAMRLLGALAGRWETDISIGGRSMLRGRAAFEWMEGGAFLVGHSDFEPAKLPPAATMIIGRDESAETYSVLYYDSRDVSRVLQMSLRDRVWKMWRYAPGFSQRFEGTFSDDGKTIRGSWEKSGDGSNWEHDFDLTYTRVR